MKKILILLLAVFLCLTGCEDKKQDTPVTPKASEETVATPEATEPSENVTPTEPTQVAPPTEPTQVETPAAPTCTPKKFSGTYSYVYETKEACQKNGNNDYFTVLDTINSEVNAYGCDEIVDDCGTTYYGVFFYVYEDDMQKKVYY
ncbi:MAG: hypothetical protein MR031_00495 [Tenericutes bacterium]|nr:hypothetical protein [Mycoplasmatota bacterium]